MSAGTLLLTRGDVAALLDLDDCIAAVEDVFRRHASGEALGPAALGVTAIGGAFHVKAAGLPLERPYFAAKLNANFPDNPARRGRPAIQGLIMLCDAEAGYPLAVMDSIEITIQRTGAATAVAARHLARPDSRTVTICGCGNQGAVQLRALTRVLPIERAYAFDRDAERARAFAADESERLGIAVDAVDASDLARAVSSSQVCVTATPSRRFFLEKHMVAPGTFIAAVGADNPDKQELEPTLLTAAKVVADIREQCAEIGEVHHALENGVLSLEDVEELSDLVAGRKPGRTNAEEITVFDSTGTALEDAAAAAVVYERAAARGAGARFDFFSESPALQSLRQ